MTLSSAYNFISAKRQAHSLTMANIHNYSKTTTEQITQTGGPDFGTNYGHILVSNVTSDSL